MAFYQYKARTIEGKAVSGTVEAPTQQIASQLLHKKQLIVLSLRKSSGVGGGLSNVVTLKKVKFSDVVNFTRQLSTMVTAGLSLPDALEILRTQTKNPVFAEVLGDLEQHIVGGGNLADGLSKYSQHFFPIYIALVRAGESSGTLDTVLSRLAETMETQQEFRSKVSGAMVYPIIILVGMAAVIMIMMTVVVPKLTSLYTDMNLTLPGTTRLLIAISNFFVHFWWLMIAAAAGGVFAFKKWYKTPPGEYTVDSLILRLPLFGELQKKIILVEFTRTLAMLITAGIHILDGLRVLQGSLGNVLFRNAVSDITKKVEKGFSLGESFSQHEVFPPIVSQMMKVGEETGKLDETLTKLSVYFQNESEHLVRGLTTAMEPMIMVFLGLGVGFIVISVITPIYSLTSAIK
ncbi:type II secretion system F family protein [Patescibacteria group bacterium]|nr:type II secretion system F family protein [Patescibacteria group bacterium]MBU1472437.1 type II secretion system F family protein [Patescibacteria group bacterium]MBU2460252.1 type II secretion system F family protein [Patescibacteria group bacterium]MBU2544723.1 type II secretion system F family protein [Patescibacteria group bacterium]